MTANAPAVEAGKPHPEHLSLCDLFIDILTVISLGVMFMQFFLPASAPAKRAPPAPTWTSCWRSSST